MYLYKAIDQQKIKEENRKMELLAKPSVSNVTGIPNIMKSQFETSSGVSFDDVRVHFNSDKPSMFQSLAYTRGDEIHIGADPQCNVIQMVGERDALRATMKKKKKGDTAANIVVEEGEKESEKEEEPNPIRYSIRRGNRKGSQIHTKDESLARLNLLRQKYTQLEESFKEKFHKSDSAALQAMIRARASYVAGVGNCNEFSAIAFSHLVSNTQNQYVYSCRMVSTELGKKYDHVFIVTSPKLYSGEVFPDEDNYVDAVVVDPWKKYTVCTFKQFLNGEHPYYNSKENKILKPSENILIEYVTKANPDIKFTKEQKDFIDNYMVNFEEEVKQRMIQKENLERLKQMSYISISSLGNMPESDMLKKTGNKEYNPYFDSKEPWIREINDVRPMFKQLDDLDSDNIEIVLKIVFKYGKMIFYKVLKNKSSNIISSIIIKIIRNIRLGKIKKEIIRDIPYDLINKMEELDALSVLNILEEYSEKKAGTYLINTYVNFFGGENAEYMKKILGYYPEKENRAVGTLIKYNCWKAIRSKL